MTITSQLIQNMAEFFTASSIAGGSKMNNSYSNSYSSSNKSGVLLYSMFFILVALLLKGIIVYLLYNYMVPKLIYSLSSSTSNNKKTYENIVDNFRTLSLTECILLVILFNTLFNF